VDKSSRHRGAKLRTQFVLSGAISLFNYVNQKHFCFFSIFHKMVQTISSFNIYVKKNKLKQREIETKYFLLFIITLLFSLIKKKQEKQASKAVRKNK